jgi:hypothetical protein
MMPQQIGRLTQQHWSISFHKRGRAVLSEPLCSAAWGWRSELDAPCILHIRFSFTCNSKRDMISTLFFSFFPWKLDHVDLISSDA